MTQRHHWQCSFDLDQLPHECDCGLTGPRDWRMDILPADRAPTQAETTAFLAENQRRQDAAMIAASDVS